MATNKNQIPTIVAGTAAKYLTVNKVADQLDSSFLFLNYEVITALPIAPVTNKAYLINFGINSGKIRYYYNDTLTSTLIAVDIPTNIGDVIGDYVRVGVLWVLNRHQVLSGTNLVDSNLKEGLNYISSNASFTFSYTGNLYTSLPLANPITLPAGFYIINKIGNNYYVGR